MNELNFFQSWLHRILILISDAAYAAEKWGQRLEQKPKKQAKSESLDYEQQNAKQRALKSNNRVSIQGTNVTGSGIYTQDWSKEETVEERIARLKRAASQSTKANRR